MSLIYEGKAKKILTHPERSDLVLMEFKDSLTAFNAQKLGSFVKKGILNRDISALIFEYLAKRGISSHYLKIEGERMMLTKKVQIIPLEVVVRNVLAGSTAKKLGIPEGKKLEKPLLEFYYKNDELQDPFINDEQVLMLEVANESEIAQIKKIAHQVNLALVDLFKKIDVQLVDFKIEFGRHPQEGILLADEISPDCARLWDIKTGEKMDKDRFRRDLGDVDKYYQEIWQRLSALRGSL